MLDLKGMRIFILTLLMIPCINLTIGYKRFQTVLLNWPVFFNMPIFFIFYSGEGRFYTPAFISLIFTASITFFDKEFHSLLKAKKRGATLIAMIGALILFFGRDLDSIFLESKIRYSAPFLDPKKSAIETYWEREKALFVQGLDPQ